MLKKNNKKLLNEIFIKNPKLSDREIAKQTKISHPTISKYRKEFWSVIDKEFVDSSIKQCIHEMRRSVEHWKLLIQKNYEMLENNKKQITAIVMEDGKKTIKGTTVELSPDDKSRILHEIAELEVKIQEYGNDREISEILKLMVNGQIQ